ncbi:hypothetical protein TWF718_006482 [Orbilia javanica]|uniref:Uncharacterized protein n=1 Tax=Orbilia javanica TaxID=47235 RepID=A0AAN8N383_9PEZI
MSQQIVYKNWPCATPSWTEVLLDLVHFYLQAALLHLAAIMGTPLRDLDSLWEKVVKVAVPFTIIWGLSCWGDNENRRASLRVLSWVKPYAIGVFEPVLAVVGALVATAAMPSRYVRRLNSRVATVVTTHAAQGFLLDAAKWVASLLGLVIHCAKLAGCVVAIAPFAIVVYVPNPFQIHVGFRRWRTRVAEDVWCWFFPLPPVERSVIPLIRRKRTFEEELKKARGDLYLVLPTPYDPPSPPLPSARSPLPPPPSPMPDCPHLFAYPPPPPAAARPAGEGTIRGPAPQRYRDRRRSRYFQGPHR